MNDVIDMTSVVKVNAEGGVDSASEESLEKIGTALDEMEKKLSKLVSCTVRIRLRVEYEVLEENT